MRVSNWRFGLVAVGAIGLTVLLRVVALDSDPYARLSWSSGLLTDEGFYIHNARNLALFGTERTDEFNNMLIMPTLHFVQIVVFQLWGPGAVTARMISVVCSLLALLVLFAAARRAFGVKVAALAALFIGLDHTNLLYNRLALMDTPGEMLLVFALYAWVRGLEPGQTGVVGASRGWMVACGMLLGLAFVTRGLAGIVIPAAALAAWIVVRKDAARSAFIPLAAGLVAVLACYAIFWYLPHRAELARINHYYLWSQLLPNSGPRLALNFANAWFGDERGAAPFLMRHTPVQIVLVFGWILFLFRRRGGKAAAHLGAEPIADCFRGPTAVLVLCWLGFAALFLSVASYSPSRYYLLFYPALALACAFALTNMRGVVEAVVSSRMALLALGGYAGYHAGLLAWHHASIAAMAAVGCSALVGGILSLVVRTLILSRWNSVADPVKPVALESHGPTANIQSPIGRPKSKIAKWVTAAPAAVLVCWAAINGFYLSDWLAHLKYDQRDASRWLAANLPAGTVLIGDITPGLSLYNRFRAIPVIPGLCNDLQPLDRYEISPAAVVILDGSLKPRWWTDHYPQVVRTENRIILFPKVVRFPVGVYRVR